MESPEVYPLRRRYRYPGVKMTPGECRQTRRGVTYCYVPEGVRFCPRDARTAEECRARLRITGDRRRGMWVRRRIGRGEVI